MKKLLTRTMLLLATALVLFTACDNSETRVEDAVYATDITLSESSITILAEDEDLVTLTATVSPEGTTAEGVKWASRNTAIATVDEDGEVTGVSGGTTTIIAISADGTAMSNECTVTVLPCVADLILQVKDDSGNLVDLDGVVTTYKNKNEQLVATVSPEGAYMKSDAGEIVSAVIEWESSDESVMTVDSEGNITPLVAGEAMITATVADGSQYDLCTYTVEVVYATTATWPNTTPITLAYGETLQLESGMDPWYADNQTMWSTSAATVVTAENGLLVTTGVGTATITFAFRDESQTDVLGSYTVDVTVTAVYVTAMELDQTEASMVVGGEDLTLTASFPNENPSDKGITWTSSDEAVATVVDGVVTAVSAGTANITATADGSEAGQDAVTATCEVTVGVNYVTEMSISSEAETMTLGGEALTLTAKVTVPEDASVKTITWTSDNEAVATVVDGVVTALTPGTANITATADGASADAPVSKTCVVTVENAYVTGLTMEESITLVKGADATYTLTPVFTPTNPTDDSITWAVKDGTDTVVTVDDGVITVVGTGTVTVTATANGIEPSAEAVVAECVVTVSDVYVTDIAIDQDATSYVENSGVVALTATLTPEKPTNSGVKWSVLPADSAVSIVEATGVMTIGELSGDEAVEFTVTALAEGTENSAEVKDEYKFTVTQGIAVTGVTVTTTASSNQLIVSTGTLQLAATVAPSDATIKDVVWSSADTSIATVDQNGLVTAGSTTGYVMISAKSGAITATYEVSVVPDPTGITVVATSGSGDLATLLTSTFGEAYTNRLTTPIEKVVITGNVLVSDLSAGTVDTETDVLKGFKIIDLSGATFSANTLAGYTFADHTDLEEVILPNHITSTSSAFYNCTALKRATMPTGSTTAAYALFSGCTSLTYVNQDWFGGLMTFSPGAFKGVALEEITFGENLTTLKGNGVQLATSLKKATFTAPATSVTPAIYHQAFGSVTTGAPSLEEIILPWTSSDQFTISAASPFPYQFKIDGGTYHLTIPDGTLEMYKSKEIIYTTIEGAYTTDDNKTSSDVAVTTTLGALYRLQEATSEKNNFTVD
ncbi:MAG: Ig-like domain-containing protein [Rikenellaceae bacterium]